MDTWVTSTFLAFGNKDPMKIFVQNVPKHSFLGGTDLRIELLSHHLDVDVPSDRLDVFSFSIWQRTCFFPSVPQLPPL